MRQISADVIVVGGGAAGCYAALELKKKGLRPLIVCKGWVGKSGASIFAGNLVVSGRALGNTDQQARDTAEFLIRYHNQFLIDQDWAARCGKWIEGVYYSELEEAGLYLRRDDAGNVVYTPGKIRGIAANVQGFSGVPLMDLRRKQIIRESIPRLEEVAVTALLQREDGSVGGVFALDYLRGEYVLATGRAVLLATGYSDRLYHRATGTREMSADGLAMAWRAGANLVNLEMQWWHVNDFAHPPSWQRVQIYPNPMLGSEKSARMTNSSGEEFFNQQQDDPLAFGPYTIELKALRRQVHAGHARYDGGYYSGFDHCSAEEVEAYTSYAKGYRQLGLPFPETMIETAVTAHYRQGGVDVDTTTMRTSVPGLYVAGGLGGHSNGLIALATYDGKVAADGIGADFAGLPAAEPDRAGVGREEERISRLRAAKGDVRPESVKDRIRRIMWEDAGVEKSAAGLNRALERLAEVRRDLLPRVGLSSDSAVCNYEWLDSIDVINMLDACDLIIASALHRTESRGPFMRTDFPEMDNVNWLAANVMVRAGEEIRFKKRPYALTSFRPEFERKDNLEVAW